MKINKYTAVLAALGVISLAGVAQATNYEVYLTGSTAARQQVFNALTTAGQVFTAAGVVQIPAGETGSDNQFVVRGVIGSDTIDFNCSFSGSEAGIASVANTDLTQPLPNDPHGSGPYELPGLKANLTFYTPSVTAQGALPTYAAATFSALPNGVGNNEGVNVTFPDLAMADTSPAVSRTSASLVHDYGFFAVVPFTFMKGYQATPDQAWTDLTNITLQEGNIVLANGDIEDASVITGIPADQSDGVAFIGRNFGSGTRVNLENNALQTPILAKVDQWTYDGNGSGNLNLLYPAGTPGTLTWPGNAASGQQLVDIGDDGYDSGKYVGYSLDVDGTGCGSVLLGYLGMSDAKNAAGAGLPAGGHAATYIKYNGVYESDTAVEQGSYAYWGYEHVVGSATASSAGATEAGNALIAGLPAAVASLGSVAGDVTTAPQSALIPLGKMFVSRGGKDTGFPKH